MENVFSTKMALVNMIQTKNNQRVYMQIRLYDTTKD
jgi:hypothetical protein